MKVNCEKPLFRPVTVTLESQQEVAALLCALWRVKDWEDTHSISFSSILTDIRNKLEFYRYE